MEKINYHLQIEVMAWNWDGQTLTIEYQDDLRDECVKIEREKLPYWLDKANIVDRFNYGHVVYTVLDEGFDGEYFQKPKTYTVKLETFMDTCFAWEEAEKMVRAWEVNKEAKRLAAEFIRPLTEAFS